MTEGEALARVAYALAQRDFRANDISGRGAFAGTVDVAGQPVRVELAIPCLKFSSPPRARMTHRSDDLPHAVAHIEAADFICYAPPGSMVLDLHRPGESVLHVLDRVALALNRSVGSDSQSDIAREFPQHWRAPNTVRCALPLDAAQGMACLLSPRFVGAVDQLILTRRDPKGGFDGGAMGHLTGPVVGKAWIGKVDRHLTLPVGSVPEHFAAFLEWAEGQQSGLGVSLQKAASNKFFKELVNLFVLAPNGGIGVSLKMDPLWMKAAKRREFWAGRINNHAAEIGVDRIALERMDASHAITRGAVGEATLLGKSILVVGCGSIGSHLARLLVQSGAGHGGGRLILVDDDDIKAANLSRHWLGAMSIGQSKAVGCAEELKRLHPGVMVSTYKDNVMHRLDLLRRVQLVIDATGEEGLSRALNHELVQRRPDGPDAIFTWLVGQGAAAQALFVPNRGGGLGCLCCARPFGESNPVLRPDAPIEPVAATCGEAEFMPYGVASPVLATGLAGAMALDWASGAVTPSYRTIRVDNSVTVDQSDADVLQRADCPECGTRLE